MRKTFVLIICIIVCGLVACNGTDVTALNQEAKTALTEVLNCERNFTVKNEINHQLEEKSLYRYSFASAYGYNTVIIPTMYVFVDMDSDGTDELVILSLTLDWYLVLRYEDGQVYGYNVRADNPFNLRTDGSFMPDHNRQAVTTMSMYSASYEFTERAVKCDDPETYLIDGKETDKETVEKYIEEWNETTSKVTWIDIEWGE